MTRALRPSGPALGPTVARLGAVGAGALVLLVGLVLASGGGPPETLPGLSGAGRLVGWSVPVLRLVGETAAVATIGCLLYGGYLVPPRSTADGVDRLRRPAAPSVRAAAGCAAVWAVAAGLGAVLTLGDIAGVPLGELADRGLLDQLVRLDQSRSLLLSAALALLVAVSAWRVRTSDGPLLVLVLAAVAVVPPLLTGHAAGVRWGWLAVLSLAVHVLAASLWAGGLGALVAFRCRRPGQDALVVGRFSRVALVCFVAVALSGLVNALIRLGGLGPLLGTSYGSLVLAKLAAFGVLGWFGWWHRRHTVARPDTALFRRVAARELIVMLGAVVVAVALSRTPTPSAFSGDTPAGGPGGHGHALAQPVTGQQSSRPASCLARRTRSAEASTWAANTGSACARASRAWPIGAACAGTSESTTSPPAATKSTARRPTGSAAMPSPSPRCRSGSSCG